MQFENRRICGSGSVDPLDDVSFLSFWGEGGDDEGVVDVAVVVRLNGNDVAFDLETMDGLNQFLLG